MDHLPLFHSWPLYDVMARMDLQRFSVVRDDGPSDEVGLWSCDLATNALSWTPEVYSLFGLPQDEPLTRDLAVACYGEKSRAAMEALRAHTIEHKRGFTIDAMIRRPNGDARWMRLSAVPTLENGKVVRLWGTKQDVTMDYDGPDWQRV